MIAAQPTISEMAHEVACLVRREAMGLEHIELMAARDPGSSIGAMMTELLASQARLVATYSFLKSLVPFEAQVRALPSGERRA